LYRKNHPCHTCLVRRLCLCQCLPCLLLLGLQQPQPLSSSSNLALTCRQHSSGSSHGSSGLLLLLAQCRGEARQLSSSTYDAITSRLNLQAQPLSCRIHTQQQSRQPASLPQPDQQVHHKGP
jgi:hypothetical protein